VAAVGIPGNRDAGVELSRHMAERMLAKPGAEAATVTIGGITPS
jgi:hypothetical protein